MEGGGGEEGEARAAVVKMFLSRTFFGVVCFVPCVFLWEKYNAILPSCFSSSLVIICNFNKGFCCDFFVN